MLVFGRSFQIQVKTYLFVRRASDRFWIACIVQFSLSDPIKLIKCRSLWLFGRRTFFRNFNSQMIISFDFFDRVVLAYFDLLMWWLLGKKAPRAEWNILFVYFVINFQLLRFNYRLSYRLLEFVKQRLKRKNDNGQIISAFLNCAL